MTNGERASQVWAVLAFAARTQKVVSYKMVEKLTGIPRFGLSQPLGLIYYYCERNSLPPLTSLVIEQETGKPAYAGGFQSVDIPAAHARVFVFDWLERTAPTVADLEEAGRAANTSK